MSNEAFGFQPSAISFDKCRILSFFWLKADRLPLIAYSLSYDMPVGRQAFVAGPSPVRMTVDSSHPADGHREI